MTKRQCGKCSLCCKLLAIPVLSKPGNVWCKHRVIGGCSIYAERPEVCHIFACQWLSDPSLGDEWYPPRAKMFCYLDASVTPRILRVLVDAGAHGRWRISPYREQLARVAAAGLIAGSYHTVAQYGERIWLITPTGDHEVTGKAYVVSERDGRWSVDAFVDLRQAEEFQRRGNIARR